MYFLDYEQQTLLIDDCCDVIPTAGGWTKATIIFFFFFFGELRFSTTAKIVVMLLCHRAENNWEGDKDAHTFFYKRRDEKYFGCRENHSLKKPEKVKAAEP